MMRILALITLLLLQAPAWAHHILGRPAYSLNEDSNTPPSMEVEAQVGDYDIRYMIFPAFPQPGKPGRINLYLRRLDDGSPYEGEVTFTVRDDGWFSKGKEELLGTQREDERVFRQGFVISEPGDYIVTARFEAGGEPYIIDFPLRIGEVSRVTPLLLAAGALLLFLGGISILQRRRLQREKIRLAHESER